MEMLLMYYCEFIGNNIVDIDEATDGEWSHMQKKGGTVKKQHNHDNMKLQCMNKLYMHDVQDGLEQIRTGNRIV